MRQVIEFAKRAITRVNARVAMLVAVLAAGGVAVWQGVAHWPASQLAGPTKQIATGVVSSGEGSSPVVEQASATIADAQPGASDANQLWAAGRQTSSGQTSGGYVPPPTSPYSASVSDAATAASNGSGPNSSYAASTSFAATNLNYGPGAAAEQPPAAPPVDPSVAQPAASIPENPYRSAGAASSAPPSETVPTAALPAEGGSSSAADLAAAYANQYSQSPAHASSAAPPSAKLPPRGLATESEAPASVAPPNRLPASEAVVNPYAAADAGLSRLQTVYPPTSPQSREDGSGRLAANKPGDRQLEGAQQPALLLEKVSPAEIQVGKSA